jgi:hypothetical protein
MRAIPVLGFLTDNAEAARIQPHGRIEKHCCDFAMDRREVDKRLPNTASSFLTDIPRMGMGRIVEEDHASGRENIERDFEISEGVTIAALAELPERERQETKPGSQEGQP